MQQETYTKEVFWSELDRLGEDSVLVMHRVEKRWGVPPHHKAELVELWLKRQQDARAFEASKQRDAREEETLAIARSALENSRKANFIAIAAAVLAVVAAIGAAVIQSR